MGIEIDKMTRIDCWCVLYINFNCWFTTLISIINNFGKIYVSMFNDTPIKFYSFSMENLLIEKKTISCD